MSRVREATASLPSVLPGFLSSHGGNGEDAARTSACLKACEGIPTSLLEGGFVTRLVVACLHVDDRRVQEVLDDLVPATKRQRRTRSGEV